jgi:hypothetical protein
MLGLLKVRFREKICFYAIDEPIMRQPNNVSEDQIPPSTSVLHEYGGKRLWMLDNVRVVDLRSAQQKVVHEGHFGGSQT